LAQLPLVGVMVALAPWSGSLTDRFGPRPVLILGPLLVGTGFALMALPDITHGPADYWTTYLPPLLLLGAGLAMTIVPVSTTLLESVPAANPGLAAGINSTASRLAG